MGTIYGAPGNYDSAAPPTLGSALSDSATSLALTSGHGAKFAAVPPYSIWIGAEKIGVTNRSTDTLTVVRGLDGTTPTAHDAGATILFLADYAQVNLLATELSRVRAQADYGSVAVHLHLDNAVTDSSPWAHSGTATGSPSYVTGVFGNANGALSFNGSTQYVTYPTSPHLALGYADWYMEVQLKLTANVAAGDQWTIAGRDNPGSTAGAWQWDIGNYAGWDGGANIWSQFYCSDGSSHDLRVQLCTIATGFGTTNWHHLAVACSGSCLRYYMDGTLKGVIAAPWTAVPLLGCSSELVVGASGMSYGQKFKGYLDEFLICRGTAGRYVGASYTVPTAAHVTA